MPIQWDDAFMTGVISVDHQHKELFRKVNAFHAAMMEGKAREELGRLLDFLAQYTQQHFRDEEKFMEYYECPAAEANRQAHQALLHKYINTRKCASDSTKTRPVFRRPWRFTGCSPIGWSNTSKAWTSNCETPS